MAAGRRQNDLFGVDPAELAKAQREKVLNRIVWTDGVALLEYAGVAAEAARSFLGRRIGEVGRDAIARAIVSAYVQNVIDARKYLGAVKARPEIEEDAPAPLDTDGDYAPAFFDNDDGAE